MTHLFNKGTEVNVGLPLAHGSSVGQMPYLPPPMTHMGIFGYHWELNPGLLGTRFALLVFIDTFSTIRLYRVIGV